MWTYNQKTGEFSNGDSLFSGYAGLHEGKNNPDMEAIHDKGPLPRGRYTIAPPRTHPTLGPYAMPLLPLHSNTMFGRTGFYIHADSIHHPGEASHGCIVLSAMARTSIWLSGNHELTVI